MTDNTGTPVAGLTKMDFGLAENGSAVDVMDCRQERVAKLAAVLVIDCSGSMNGRSLAAAKAAATAFLRRMGPADLCSVMAFRSTGEGTAAFHKDKSAAIERVASLRAGGWTAFHDAVFRAIQQLRAVSADRKAVVALTDGQDNRSGRSVDDAIASANANDVEVYSIGMGNADRSLLKRLSDETGGLSLSTSSPDQLVNCFGSIFGAITTTYSLSYDSPNAASDPPLRTVSLAAHNGDETGHTRVTYNVPSGITAGTDSTMFGEPVSMLLIVALLANIVLIASLLSRRRSARRSAA